MERRDKHGFMASQRSPIQWAGCVVVIIIGVVSAVTVVMSSWRPIMENTDFAQDYASVKARAAHADPYGDTPTLIRRYVGKNIALWPQWICPIGPQAGRFSLYAMKGEWTINFGFWDVKRTREPHPPGHFNRMIELKVAELGGIKSLYSDSYFTPEEFERYYGGAAYRALKAKYDPQRAFPELYEKCVLRR